jgi:hypothetical protein
MLFLKLVDRLHKDWLTTLEQFQDKIESPFQHFGSFNLHLNINSAGSCSYQA